MQDQGLQYYSRLAKCAVVCTDGAARMVGGHLSVSAKIRKSRKQKFAVLHIV